MQHLSLNCFAMATRDERRYARLSNAQRFRMTQLAAFLPAFYALFQISSAHPKLAGSCTLGHNECNENRHAMLPHARLVEIERLAAAWREKADTAAAELKFAAPSAIDLVTVVLSAPVDACANLERNGRRLAGLLEASGAVPHVWYEAYDPQPRQRFSVAHELGHFALHKLRGASLTACGQDAIDQGDEALSGADPETEADAFAGAFLIPAQSFLDAVHNFGFCAGFLAEWFQISQTAIRRRQKVVGGL